MRGFMGMAAAALLVLAPVPAWAGAASGPRSEPGRLPFVLVGTDQGLPSGSVSCMAQDAEGFLWMGTETGLARYEGGHARVWGTADGLPSPFVTRLLAGADGTLWVGTQGGLVRRRKGRVEPVALPGAPADAPVSDLVEDGRGRIWILTTFGLFRQEGEGFVRVPWQEGAILTLAAGGPDGTVHAGCRSGVVSLLPDGSRRRWGPESGLFEGTPRILVEDGQGRLWAGAGPSLAVKLPGAARFQDRSALLSRGLSPNGDAWRDRDGSVWFPTQDGALHLAGERAEPLGAAEGLPMRWSRTLFRDREGALWVMGPALARMLGGGRVRNYALSPDGSGEIVWCVARGRDGRLYLGSDDGASWLGPEGLVHVPGTEARRVKALVLDRTGTLWMVGTMGPTLWLRPGAARAEVAPLGEEGSRVNTVMEDRDGRVWLGHASLGLVRWDPERRRLATELSPADLGKPSLGVMAIRQGADGRLWAATDAGLSVRGGDGRWTHFGPKDGLLPQRVNGLDFLPDGSAWIHYQDLHGIVRVKVEGDRLTVLGRRGRGQGLRTDMVYALRVDARGRTWVATDRGLDRLDPPLHVGREAGMANEDCSLHALLLEGDRAWVGTAGGLVRYDDLPAEAPAPPPQARVVGLEAGSRRLEPPFGDLGPVPHREASVAFRVAAPVYEDERALRFQVRLLGVEDGWRDLEGRTIRYSGLDGGRYRFEVRARLGEGPWGPAETLAFQVRPPWWKTWWAELLWALSGLAALGALVRWRVSALARSKAALEDLVARRTEELRARNAELSDALAHVKQLSGLLPICASCKMIRDDKGYWNQLEDYISRHSEAGFTHGICPDCAKALYPGYGGRKREKDG